MVRVTTYIYPIDHHTNNLDDDATTTAALRLGLALLPRPQLRAGAAAAGGGGRVVGAIAGPRGAASGGDARRDR